MNRREFAIELINKFRFNATHPIEDADTNFYHQKQCALIAVDLVLQELRNYSDEDYIQDSYEWYVEIKDEINKL